MKSINMLRSLMYLLLVLVYCVGEFSQDYLGVPESIRFYLSDIGYVATIAVLVFVVCATRVPLQVCILFALLSGIIAEVSQILRAIGDPNDLLCYLMGSLLTIVIVGKITLQKVIVSFAKRSLKKRIPN